MQSRQEIHQKLNEYLTTVLVDKLSSPLLKKINCLNKGDFNKRFDIRLASEEKHLGHWWRNPIYLLAKTSAKNVTLNFTLQPQRWPSNIEIFTQEKQGEINNTVSAISKLLDKYEFTGSKVLSSVKTEGKFLLSLSFAITFESPTITEMDYLKCIDFIAELALLNHQLSEELMTGIKDNEVQEEIDEEDLENELGFPLLSLTLGDNVSQEILSNYFARWQKPSVVYNGVMNISACIPDFVTALTDDNISKVFSSSDLQFIENTIIENKIIPILDFYPSEFTVGNDKPWWVVPYSIWREENASLLVLNKNGIFALYEDTAELKRIFGMDSIEKVEFEKCYEGDKWINRLYVHAAEGYITLDEFVLSDAHVDSASYLSILNSIISIRQATILASKGAPMWYEGVGNEGFSSMDSAEQLINPEAWVQPYRPNPSDFGYSIETTESADSANEFEEIKSILMNDTLASIGFLYTCVAGVESGISEVEMNMVKSKLSEWKEDGEILECLNFVLSFWKTLDSDQEKLIVEEISHKLKADLNENNLKAIKADLLQIADADNSIEDAEKGIILFICKIWD
jgi:hypothetical protein